MLDGGVALDHVIVFVVVAPAGQDHGAAVAVEGGYGRQLRGTVGPGIGLGVRQAAGGGGEDQGLELGIGAGGDELVAGLQFHGADVVLARQVAEVAHGILVVTGHILVVVGGVDADIYQVVGIQHVQGNVLGEHILLAVLLQHHGGGDLVDTGGIEGDVIAQG